MFSDHRFQVLGIHYARLDVAWNAVEYEPSRSRIADWLEDAKADRVRPLITFDHGQQPGWREHLPSAARFGVAFRRFRAQFPWVGDFATWNEANYCGEPTCKQAGRVAHYYQQIREYCRGCEVLGAELLDESNMNEWTSQFRGALGGGEPEIWGLHNYIGANRLKTGSTVRLLEATKAPIWLTETGGVVSRSGRHPADFTASATHAALVTRFLFGRILRLSRRIKRIYIYQWDGGGPRASWDSGLIAPNGRSRPAYDVFVEQLSEFGQLPNTFAAQTALADASAWG
ncbi:MAG TPA: hypothetical protein VID48_15965 [Solirubrobacteraceae bacterium]|jgi:hypothetical protein